MGVCCVFPGVTFPKFTVPKPHFHSLEWAPADSDDDIDFENDILDDVVAAVHDLGDRDARSDDAVIEAVRRVVRRAVRDRRGKRPLIDVHLVRL